MLTNEQRAMVADNYGLLWYGYNRYNKKTKLSSEEVYDCMTEAIVKAAIGFDEARGGSFATYFLLIAKTQILLKLRWYRQKARDQYSVVSTEKTISTKENKITVGDLLPANENQDCVETIALRHELSKLNETESKVIYELFYGDKSQDEIAKEMGTSQAQISRFKVRALKKLRRGLEKTS